MAKEFKKFEIIGVIAKTAMSEMYQARDLDSGQLVALKILPRSVASNIQYKERFTREIKINRVMNHPNIVKAVDGGLYKGYYYIALEYIDGMNLEKFLSIHRKLPWLLAAYIANEILRGLSYSHKMGVIHRDVKPSNIMISNEGEIKLTDFGILKAENLTVLTQTGHLVGTPSYMSPEQVILGNIDARSDLFALGVILYEMLAGEHPYEESTIASTMMKIVQKSPKSLLDIDWTIPLELCELVNKMLTKEVSNRYQSADEAIADLENICKEYKSTLFGKQTFIRFLKDPQQVQDEINTTFSRIHNQRGDEIYNKNRNCIGEALWHYHLAVSLDPNNKDAHRKIQRFSAIKNYRIYDEKTPSIEDLEKEVAQDPYNFSLLLRLAKLHVLNNNFIGAVLAFRRLISLRPNDTYINNQLYQLLGKESNPAEISSQEEKASIDDFSLDEIRTQAPHSKGRFKVPEQRKRTKKDESQVNLKLRYILFTMIGIFLVGMTSVLLWPKLPGLGRDREGSRVAGSGSARQLQTTDAQPRMTYEEMDIMLSRANRSYRDNKLMDAYQLYDRFIHVYLNNEKLVQAKFHKGLIQESLGNIDAAKAIYREIQKNYPNSQFALEAQLRTSKILIDEGKYDEAKPIFAALYDSINRIQDMDERTQVALNYARVLMEQARHDEAIEKVDYVIKEKPQLEWQIKAKKLKAMILQRKGLYNKAMELYEELLSKVNPDSQEAALLRKEILDLKEKHGL